MRKVVAISVIAGVLLVDQAVKCLVKTTMALYERIVVAPWFELHFVENEGFAFGMGTGDTFSLALFRIAAIGAFIYILARTVRRRAPMGLVVCFALVVAGAVGNIIDNAFYGLIFSESVPGGAPACFITAFGEGYGRFLQGRVVDMFYFPLFTWPDWMPWLGGRVFFGAVFNVADAAITCGFFAILLFYGRSLTADSDKNSAAAPPDGRHEQ